MGNINIVLEGQKLHELEVIRENDLRDFCDIIRFSPNPREEALKKLEVILDLNEMIRKKENEMILTRIKAENNGKNI